MQALIESVGSLSAKERKALAVLLKQKGINLFSVVPIFKRDTAEPLLLSFAQERQWFLWHLDPMSSAYHIPTALRLRGALDVPALERAFNVLVSRHESLRTALVEDQGQVVQVIHAAFDLTLHTEPLLDADPAALQARVEQESRRLFDLRQAPLWRVSLLRVADDDHVLVLTQHHIISDGWSMQVMIDELMHCYQAFIQGQAPTLPALPIQYADYALWQRQWMEAGERERQLGYWTAQLADEPGVLSLPYDHSRPAQLSDRGARVDLQVPEALATALNGLAQRENVTLFMLLLASFQTLLHRYSGQADIRVGVPTANRNRVETEGLIGFFVNTQVLKADFAGVATFTDLLQQVRSTVQAAQDHQDLPFEQLVEALHPQRTLSHSPLFQIMYNHQSEGRTRQAGAGPVLQVENLTWDKQTSQFDLTLNTHESGGQLSASLTYATDLFDRATIERMAGHWLTLLQALVDNAWQRIDLLPLLTGAEQAAQAQACSGAVQHYDESQCIHRQIEARVAEKGDTPALYAGEQVLGYDEINRRANALAHRLIELGVGPEVRVAVAMPRAGELLVALLGVLKAGGAYVPLDPDYPPERVAYMLDDSRAQVIITQQALLAELPALDALHVVLLEPGADLGAQGYSQENPDTQVVAQNLAYVIYTSGSTGKPKGVAIAHRSVMALMRWSAEVYPEPSIQGVLASTSVCFDLSVWELFVTLGNGGSLVLARNALELPQLAAREQVRLINTVPSAIAGLHRAGQIPASVRIINLAGEPLKQGLVDDLYAQASVEHVYDLYGPSEDTTYSTWARREPGGKANIGLPLGNTRGYLLDPQLQTVPTGVAAELYLAGHGITRGYLGRPGLTAERFVPDPFAADGQRMYRTGDLIRHPAQAPLEYVGRIDHQVKVRGFRIELGEIEARLLALDELTDAVVLAVEGAVGQQLVGYVVPNTSAGQVDGLRTRIKAALREHLPDYMVPAQLVLLERLPLTPNGKLDRKALPLPDASPLPAYVAPQSSLEQTLAGIWQDVLKREQVGVTDNFFELGGDSIITLQVVSRARQAGVTISAKQLFQHQTVQGLASVAEVGGQGLVIDQAALQGLMPLLPIHHEFFATPMPQRHHWNQSVLLQPGQVLDAGLLGQALQTLFIHHDALRLVFSEHDGHWRARYRALDEQPAPVLLEHMQGLDIAGLEAACQQAQASLDLEQGPLLRALLVDLDDGSQRLLLVIHHLVVDGVSWRVLFEDLQAAYHQLQARQAVQLPAKTSSVKAWAERLGEYAHSDALRAELGYWQAQLQGADSGLPCERPGGALGNQHAATVHRLLDQGVTRQLLQQAPAAYRTQVNDLLLSALALVISRWTGRADTLIKLEGHGREALFDDIDLTRSVGWFTSAFPLRLTAGQDIDSTLKQVKEQLRALPAKGLGFGVLRHLGDDATRAALAGLPQPRITFNYLGQFDASFNAAGDAWLRPASEYGGAQQSTSAPLDNWLNISGKVFDGRLSLSWTYSEAMFDHATIEHLADQLISQLQVLVQHCLDEEVWAVTPSDFPLANLSQAQLDALPLPAARIDDLYGLSAMQQGMLFHSLYQHGTGDYISQMRLDIHGLDPQRFAAAWQAVIDSHDILRTGFVWQNLAQPVQVVQRRVRLPYALHDWRGRSNQAQALDELADDQRQKGFDLAEAPLLRLVLVRMQDDQYHLVYTHHHILMDGWSASRLLGEVLQRYSGQVPETSSGRYVEYIGWLKAQDLAGSEAFWKQQLAVLSAPTRLARCVEGNIVAAAGHGNLHGGLDAQQTARLVEFCRRHKVTFNTLVQAAWLLLLQRYSGADSVCFGATVAGRPSELKGIEQQIGLFINTLPVIASPRAQQTVDQWLQAVQAQNLALREHEHTPLFEIQRWAGQGGEALFDNILVFENYPVSEALEQANPPGVRFANLHNHEQSNYPLTLSASLSERLKLHFNYDRQAFDSVMVNRLHGQLCQLLLQMAQGDGSQRLDACQVHSAVQQSALLAQWNTDTVQLHDERCLHQLIAAQAARAPQAVALSFEGQHWTYAQLEATANRWAHRLVQQGVGADVRVGLAAERGPWMIVGLLAILKAGGAYVPLDPQTPQQRLTYIIEDSAVALLLTQSALLPGLVVPAGLPILTLEDDVQGYADSTPQVRVHADNLAYVIYTSGSTGRPKGTLLPHRNAVRLFLATEAWFGFGADDVWTLFHSVAFDFSVWEIFGALIYGGRLVIVPQAVSRAPEAFYQLLCNERVTVLNQTPSAFKALMQIACSPTVVGAHTLRHVVFGGEALEVKALRPWFERFGDQAPRLINMYGITETTVHVTYRPLSLADLQAQAASPIGEPIGDLTWYVLDGDLNPVPQGATGELFIGGAGLARGYLNQPALSATRFIANPFAAQGERLYRTGDLVTQRADGAIEYIGRIDHQVKIRGFRIELGEIEAQLLALVQVREAAVLAVDGVAGQQLVAYVVAQAPVTDEHALRDSLRAHLKRQLADYMVPAHVVFIEALPLTINGKLDRKALPSPDGSLRQHNHVVPQSTLECQVAAVWQDVLGIAQVGLGDHFFELGGHSLMVVNVVSRLQLELGLSLTAQLIFQFPILADFVAQLEASGEQVNTSTLNKLESLLDEMEEI
ncbi:non-ribosomal peptide synthetase [Pseudomonas sp. S36]|uniref:non-ribosomal peptide synthetase n=1 Tax=Pseudomonas sp. S36 TaxID=2767447 RepID=UPI0019148E31|nr:non-ribosomal peptide synthetase [Pseudomonas sp. S36]MBK4991727.1 non-ribosomal peptide synthetase [Pseudomonas sp. S36]